MLQFTLGQEFQSRTNSALKCKVVDVSPGRMSAKIEASDGTRVTVHSVGFLLSWTAVG